MCVFMFVVHGHCGPLGPYPGPHTSWDPVVGPHIFAGPDGGIVGLVGLVGLVGSVVGFAFGGLDASFVGVGGLAFFLPAARASSQCRSASSVWGRGRSGSPRRGWCRPGIPPKRHHTSARGYHGRCPSLPRWGRVRGRPSRRSDPRDGHPSSRHPWGCRSWWWGGGGLRWRSWGGGWVWGRGRPS